MSYPPPSPHYGAPVPPPPQPVVKSKAGPIVGIILGVLLLVCVVCGGGFAYFTWWANDKVNEIVDSIPTEFPTDLPNNQTGPHKVRYEVNGSGEALVTWARDGSQESATVQLPWSKEITVDRASFGAQVFAFPTGNGTKLESCRLSVDGTERKKANFANNTLICSYVYVDNG